MKIGQAAQQTGLSAKAIRHYESLGLIKAQRLDNGYRQYDAAHIRQLTLLAQARQAGFSLEECRKLLDLLADKQRRSAEVKLQVEEKMADLDRQMHDLQQMRDLLASLANRCAGDENTDCAILDALTESRPEMPFRLLDTP